MTHQLDNALKRLVKESGAGAALAWSGIGKEGGGIVLGSCPVPVVSGPVLCAVPAGAGPAPSRPTRPG